MRVKKIFGSILAGVLIVSGVSMSANAADHGTTWYKGSDGEMKTDRKSTRLNSSHANESRMPSSA